MEATADISSGFDLGAELDSALNTAPVETTPEPAAPVVEEAPVDEPEAPIDEPQDEPEEAPKPQDEKAEQKPAEELPEGVEVKDRGDGKKTYTVRETQFNKLITADRTLRGIEESIGEPLTKELVQDLHEAKLSNDKMYTDFLSGDPQRAGNSILQYFKGLADHAMRNGEVQHNPFAALVMQMPQYLRQADPRGYEYQQKAYARETIDGLYQQAADSGNEDLLRAAQWVDKTVFGGFKKAADLAAQKVDPLSQRESQVAAREKAILDRQQQETAERWSHFAESTNTAVGTTRSEEIDGVLAPIKDAYKEFPSVFEGYKERLNSIARDALNKDQRWADYRNSTFERAKSAATEQVRQSLQADYLNRYRAKVKAILSPAANPTVKKMLDEGAAAVKTMADTNRQRLAAAAQRREPGGSGATKQNSVLPARVPNGGRFASADDWSSEVDSLLG